LLLYFERNGHDTTKRIGAKAVEVQGSFVPSFLGSLARIGLKSQKEYGFERKREKLPVCHPGPHR
jgi:hypothetical protein